MTRVRWYSKYAAGHCRVCSRTEYWSAVSAFLRFSEHHSKHNKGVFQTGSNLTHNTTWKLRHILAGITHQQVRRGFTHQVWLYVKFWIVSTRMWVFKFKIFMHNSKHLANTLAWHTHQFTSRAPGACSWDGSQQDTKSLQIKLEFK